MNLYHDKYFFVCYISILSAHKFQNGKHAKEFTQIYKDRIASVINCEDFRDILSQTGVVLHNLQGLTPWQNVLAGLSAEIQDVVSNQA